MKFNTLVITAATVAAAALLSPSASYYVSAQEQGTTVSGDCPTNVADPIKDTCGAIVSIAKFPSCINSANEYCRCDGLGDLNCGPLPTAVPMPTASILKDNGDEDSLDDGDSEDFIVYAGIGAGSDGVVKTSGGNAATATIALSIVAAVSMIGGTTVDLI